MQGVSKVEGDAEGTLDDETLVTNSPGLDSGEYLLQFGPDTLAELLQYVGHSFKIFWDGSISLYNTTVQSSTNNKDFLNKLLDVRMHSENDQEPPVTLIHGIETLTTLKDTLMRIKAEQQEEFERKQREAAEADDESLEEDDIGDLEESKEEISTFQEDMETIADFMVSDATQFTTKLLQGVPIRALYSFDSHRKQSVEEQQEALDLLDII